MINFIKLYKRKKPIIAAVFVGVVFSMVIFGFALYESNRVQQLKKLEATEQFAHFDNMMSTKIVTISNLIKGFEAYLNTCPETNDASIYAYLDFLMRDQLDFVNNIGILKGTTIQWNYPYEANKSSIGVDLAENESQRKSVLEVKETLRSSFQGPVKLVQGGEGYIVRSPLLDHQGNYWGMTSLVIRKESFEKLFDEYQTVLGIDVIILSGEDVLFGESNLITKDLEWFQYNGNLFDWKVGIDAGKQYRPDQFKTVLLFVVSFIVFDLITAATYLSIKANEVIRKEAIHDQLTGARNRNGLPEDMEQFMSSSNRNEHKVGIIILDLNQFKYINDTFGHMVGDIVLIETTKKLKSIARSGDIVYRVGGDEFLIIVPVISDEMALVQAMHRIKEHLFFDITVKNNTIQVGASLGHALYPDDGTTFDEIFQVADKRMYQDKRQENSNRSK